MLHKSINKAIFSVAYKSGSKYKVEGPFKVYFNPSKIFIHATRASDKIYIKNQKKSIICTASKDFLVDENNDFYAGISTLSRVPVNRSISMELIFDLVESYEFANMKGKDSFLDDSFKDDFISDDIQSINVLDKRYTCIPYLSDAFENSYPVRFVWGSNTEYIGKIENLNISLVYFSEKGAPLRANVNLTIQEGNYKKIF